MPVTGNDTPLPVAVAKPNPRNNPKMFQIFQNVQFNVVQHKKYVKEMTKLYKKLDEDVFHESFKNALLYLFTFGDTSPNVDRVIQFVATFCISLDDEEEFLLFIFEIIFDCQCVSGQSVRYRASQLLAAVLTALGEDASLDDDLCDKLLTSQMQRLQDTRGAVRCRAALALQRLQNPLDPDDDVIRAYRFHVSCDPSSSVRRAIVMSMAKSTRNVPFILERLCDIDEAVRRAAFLYIAALNVAQLKVKQRVLILKVGLTERSQRVRRVVEEILIPGWLSSFKGNIIDLLKAIRLDNAHDAKDSQYVAGKLLESLFKRLPISELLEWLPTDKSLRVIPAEKLNKETAWYWRHLAEHLQKIDDDDTLETVLPDLVILIGYIRIIVESPCLSETDDPVAFSTRQYVLHELGSMLSVYDATDPTGRTALQSLITDVLTGNYGPLSSDVIRSFVHALELVVPEVSPRMEVICSVLNSLRDPPEPEALPIPQIDCTELKLQRARLRVSLNVAMEAQEEAAKEQNYSLAAECKSKVEEIQQKLDELNIQSAAPAPVLTTIKEKVSDADTLNKCLTILNCALDTRQLKSIPPMLQIIFSELEVEIFQNPDILENALETVALFGMLDKEFAKEHKAFLFTNFIDMSNEVVVSRALRCVVDLLCVHGARLFEDEDTQTDQIQNSTFDEKKKRNTYHCIDAVEEDGSISESLLSLSPAHNTVIDLLLKLIDTSCAAYRLIIVEGLCRLIYLGHLESPGILSRLVLLWFNPATVEEDMLRQTIGVFFQIFPATVDGAQEQIQKSTLPTLRALANAPTSSPLSEIDQEAVVRFIVSLTRVNHELIDSQGAMAQVLCSYLVRHPNATEAGLACRMLALLSPPREASIALNLLVTLRDLCSKLPDKQSCRNLSRYLGALEAAERTSLNKMSHTGITEETLSTEETLQLGRVTTSLPQPIGRSTHVVINETVEEELEIDKTSPTDLVSRISNASEEAPGPSGNIDSKSVRSSSGPSIDNPTSSRSSSDRPSSDRQSSDSDQLAIVDRSQVDANRTDSDSIGISPVKKAKINKANKKKSINRQESRSNTKAGRKEKTKGKKTEEQEKGGVKRTRSQRSLVDVDRAQKPKSQSKATKNPEQTSPQLPQLPSPLKDLDSSNVTVRRSTQPQSGSDSSGSKKGNGKKQVGKVSERRVTRSSISNSSANNSQGSVFESSADETTLHTIVYDKDIEQELLDDSCELADSIQTSKMNVTIPETPDGSEESEPEPESAKPKGKRNGKK